MMPLVYTLLIVEAVWADLERYQGYLLANSGDNYCLLTANSVAEGLELCRNSSIDAILIGSSIGSTAGLNLLESLPSNGLWKYPPVTILAGTGDVTVAVRAMKLGAYDYIIDRELTPARLQLAIHSAIEQNQPQLQVPDGNRESIDLNVLQSDAQLIAAPSNLPSVLAPSFISGTNQKSELDALLSYRPAGRRIPRNLRRLTSAAIDPTIDRHSIALAAKGEFARVEMSVPKVNGAMTVAGFSLKPIFDDANRVESTIAKGDDLTDRQRTEAALLESEDRFRTLADNISQLA